METEKIMKIRSMLLEGKSTHEISAAVPGIKRQDIHNTRYRLKQKIHDNKWVLEKIPDIKEKKLPTTGKKKFKPHKKYVAKVLKTDTTKVEVTSKAPKAEKKKKFIHRWNSLHDVIKTWRLGFYSGNVVKHVARHRVYVARHRVKDGYNDLKEAKYNLDRLIDLYERGESE